MEQLLEFMANHPLLFGALGVVLGMLAWTTLQGGGARLSPQDATRLINHDDAVVLDVRGDAEFNQGHIVGAVHVPEAQLDSAISTRLQKYRARPVIAVCRSGQRSAAACAKLRKAGFEKAYNLTGGVLAWQSANLPLTRK